MEEVLLFNLDSLSGHKIVTKPKKKLESRPETPVASPRNSMVQGPIVFRLLLGSRASVGTILFAADGPPMAEAMSGTKRATRSRWSGGDGSAHAAVLPDEQRHAWRRAARKQRGCASILGKPSFHSSSPSRRRNRGEAQRMSTD